MASKRSTVLIAAVSAASLVTAFTAGLEGQAPAAQPPAAAQSPLPTGRGGAPLYDSALDFSLTDQCGGRSPKPMEACENDVNRMVAALPDTAPATPKQPRRILVLGTSRGFQHSSIPLAAKMVEEMGKKTGAWTTDVTYHAGAINAETLKHYDAIFLSSTTGTFLDEPNPFNDPAIEAVTQARRKALLDFVRSGKGLVGIHAATDSYHGYPAGVARGGGAGGGRGTTPPPPCTSSQELGARAGGEPLWPEFNRMIGGYFKFHWNYPTPITVKIDDPDNPINAPFKGQPFNTIDEVYTFAWDSFSRDNVRVLTSVDYSTMSPCDKGLESNMRPDNDYALSWVRREGQGRVYVNVLGHHESIYYNNPPLLAHILAGIQYALGDLEAPDAPVPLKR
ncbi:MAG: ThuA domain-containing protein [Acidobacteriota bacterium]|jgi:type 1 glutamine amidotransferase|nr:MAG: ThuA domain-containing protein [Acidobacteriota bacterium]